MRRFCCALVAMGSLFLFSFQGLAFEADSLAPSSDGGTTPTDVARESFLGGGSCCANGCESCCETGLLGLGLIKPTSDDFCGFISPMTNPVFFEDPRTLTEARVIWVDHTLPGALGSGNVRLLACQLRAAVSDRLSIIATKDGFFFGTIRLCRA